MSKEPLCLDQGRVYGVGEYFMGSWTLSGQEPARGPRRNEFAKSYIPNMTLDFLEGS